MGLQPASLERVESVRATPSEPVDVVADVLDDHEGVTVVGPEQPDLSRQARGALSGHRQAGRQARPWRRSPGCFSNSGRGALESGLELADRTLTMVSATAARSPWAHCRTRALDGSREHLALVARPSPPTRNSFFFLPQIFNR